MVKTLFSVGSERLRAVGERGMDFPRKRIPSQEYSEAGADRLTKVIGNYKGYLVHTPEGSKEAYIFTKTGYEADPTPAGAIARINSSIRRSAPVTILYSFDNFNLTRDAQEFRDRVLTFEGVRFNFDMNDFVACSKEQKNSESGRIRLDDLEAY